MKERLENNQTDLINQTDEHLNVNLKSFTFLFYFLFQKFANDSLRTLCLAWKQIDRSEYDQWAQKLSLVK